MTQTKTTVIYFLEGLLNDGKTWVIPIEPVPFQVGRRSGCHLALSSKSVSRNHAEVFFKRGKLCVRDAGSTNGTYVNRKRVEKDTAIEDGDIIHFGNVEFRIHLRTPSEEVEETGTLPGLAMDLPGLFVTCEQEFRILLAKKLVAPFFQPIIGMKDGRRIGYEIVGRGALPELPMDPTELFQIAAGLGCEAELSRLFWQEGIRVGSRLPGSPNLFINIHGAELSQPDLMEALQGMRRSAPDTKVTVEISEKAITDLARMRRMRSQLADLDISLAYDDFGSGQARFLELIDVPPHYLKFDHSLIKMIHAKPERFRQVVETLVKMACDLGISTVAEGVECEVESLACASLGFEYAQGFHFGRPAPIQQVQAD